MNTWILWGVALLAVWMVALATTAMTPLGAAVATGLTLWHGYDRRRLVAHVFKLGYGCGRNDEEAAHHRWWAAGSH